MAVVVSHAMRRFPTTPPDAVYSYGLRPEVSQRPWSSPSGGPEEGGESALSRSMRYADPWLYGSVRASGGGMGGGGGTAFLLTPALVLCICSEYLNGTKRSSSKNKGPTTCKKCKGARLPLSPASQGDITKFGTVRCYPSSNNVSTTTPPRAGTVRVSSSSRPSILPSTDPYDLMRRSRLSVSESSTTASQFRARSISPNQRKSGENRSTSATRNKNKTNGIVVGDPKSTLGRRSILECDINPYELMSSESCELKDSSITLVNGQRIRVRPRDYNNTTTPRTPVTNLEYEDVELRLKTPKILPKQQQQSSSKMTAGNNDLIASQNCSPTTISSTTMKTKNCAVQNVMSQKNPNENETNVETSINRFKSILKKRTSSPASASETSTTTFGDTVLDGPEVYLLRGPPSSPLIHKHYKSGSSSHFYLPMPPGATSTAAAGANVHHQQPVVVVRKKVQFLVENEIVRDDDRNDEPQQRRNDDEAVLSRPDGRAARRKIEKVDFGTDCSSHNDRRSPSEGMDKNLLEKKTENDAEKRLDEPIPENVCKLRRSESERFRQGPAKVVFHDTMALRMRKSRIDSRIFGEQDLERLDGLSSRARKISPIKLRPSEPPPPPPPEVTKTEIRTHCIENVRVGYEMDNQEVVERRADLSPVSKQYAETSKSSSSIIRTEINQNEHKEIRITDYVTSNLDGKSREKPVISNGLGLKDRENVPRELHLDKNEITFNNFNFNQNDNVTIKISPSTKNQPDKIVHTPPPLAPPRKRSNNKQPSVNVVQMSCSPSNQISVTTPSESSSSPVMKNDDRPLKTIVQISNVPAVHKLQIKNEFPDESNNLQTVSVSDSPQRKTSILITGDDCYSTVNVNDDVPLYQSSVVVKDVESPLVSPALRRAPSSVYITGNFIAESTEVSVQNPMKLVVEDVCEKSSEQVDLPMVDPDKNVVEAYNLDSHDDKDYELYDFRSKTPQKNDNDLLETFNQDNIPSSELLQEILKDPVEAVKRNLVPHVCGKSDVPRRQRVDNRKFTCKNHSESIIENHANTSSCDGPNLNSLEESFEKLRNYESVAGDDISSEHSSSTQYEMMDASSECYTDHSNRSSVTEEELANRTKFYELLADSAMIEVAESEDHHYESIKPSNNSDPIYEEIEIPPPLPANPPPSSLLDDLHLDKEYTTRSIFEGASKYDILSYLVDAKERGIVQGDSYTFNSYTNNVQSAEEEHTKESYNRVSHMSTVSDSSEDNSLILPSALTEDKNAFQKAAEVERNDSGVGSETSKSSLSKYRMKPESSAAICEDCDSILEQLTDNEPLLCRKCLKKRSERKEIITEIVETEEKYSRDLQIILEEFYQPMLVAGLLTPEQLSAIFLNTEELLENSQSLAERLRDAVEIAIEQGDEDLLTVNIGKIFLEAAPMLHGFETYCVRQGAASLLLASLEKEKELLRIFLRVSQMENTMLRRMNLNSFLMVPVQRVTKYPLLLARLYKVTPAHYETKEQLKEAQHKIELHLNHMNSETKDVPSKLWRRIGSSSGRRSSAEMDLVNIKLRKIAVDVLEWNHDEAKFALEGKLLFTQPTDNNWRKGRTIKLTPVNALLVINGKPPSQVVANNRVERTNSAEENPLVFSRHSAVREAALLLVRDKNGRYSLLREPLYLDRCVIAADPAWQSYFEVQELMGKDTFIFKAEDEDQTKLWYTQLQFHAQGMGAWRKRRNALANIMINGMGLRS